MVKNLVIVESPTKTKTFSKYLDKNFEILASFGHVRDLIPKVGAVVPEDNFLMNYQIIEKNQKHVDAICKAIKRADTLYLATDPDREGEAIAWHLYEILREKKLLTNKEVYRITSNEITKTGIKEALTNLKEINLDLVNAQQARRALDYLVGFNLSPLLWKKVQRGLSAGRVQSPALRMIVEREQEIESFKSQEYWSIEADLKKQNNVFLGRLIEYQGEKLQQFSINNKEQAEKTQKHLLESSHGKLLVVKCNKSQRKRNPAAPFITSTLQQEAIRKLGFTARRTMQVAQQLYEGIDIGEGAIGLITYMRTDSVHLAVDAVQEIRDVIKERYGANAISEPIRIFKTKSKNAQEAHEAIRPTVASQIPSVIKQYLTAEQYKLYNLIWQRTIACQMRQAIIDQVAIDLECGPGNIFRVNGSIISDPGFMLVYQESLNEDGPDNKLEEDSTLDVEKHLPNLVKGEEVPLQAIRAEQHFTEPPPRYSEATLVKALEEYGIGRPSTYATIISTLQQRKYVFMEASRFKPTDVGTVVNKFLTKYFQQYVDYDFTAKLEDRLDAIARGEKNWIPVLQDFWQPFIDLIKDIEGAVKRSDVTQEQLDEVCPKCGKVLSCRLGKSGKFIGCTGFPGCDYTRSVDNSENNIQPEVVADRSCPKCSKNLVIKVGRYGKFIGCSGYPECKFIESLNKPEVINVDCPSCKKGHFIKRKSRYGTFFYACSCYPECKYAVRNEPIKETCPNCSWPILMIKTTKRKGTEKLCPQAKCGFIESI